MIYCGYERNRAYKQEQLPRLVELLNPKSKRSCVDAVCRPHFGNNATKNSLRQILPSQDLCGQSLPLLLLLAFSPVPPPAPPPPPPPPLLPPPSPISIDRRLSCSEDSRKFKLDSLNSAIGVVHCVFPVPGFLHMHTVPQTTLHTVISDLTLDSTSFGNLLN